MDKQAEVQVEEGSDLEKIKEEMKKWANLMEVAVGRSRRNRKLSKSF
jgi:hypothetical protein